jgi:proline dehydrogenase
MSSVSFEDTEVAFAGKDDDELQKSAWLFRIMSNATIVDIGAHITQLALQIGLPVQSILKSTIYEHFCGGEDLKETEPMVSALAKHGVSTILDYGVEAKETQEEFEANLQEQLRAIAFADANASVPFVSCKITGYAPFALLEKLNEGQALDTEEQGVLDRLNHRLAKICEAAAHRDVALYVDAEESWIQDASDGLVDDLMAAWNRDKPTVFNTVQLYRHDRLSFLKRSHERARAGGYVLGVKLVRGAYMEKERARAEDMGYPSPIHVNKESVDRDFDAALVYCLENVEEIAFCAATHNEASCRLLMETAAAKGVDLQHPHIHFAQLYGMSDHISFNLARAGFNASKYVPYGPVRDVVPYLIRRAQENRSVAGQVGRELRLIQAEIKRRKNTAG